MVFLVSGGKLNKMTYMPYLALHVCVFLRMIQLSSPNDRQVCLRALIYEAINGFRAIVVRNLDSLLKALYPLYFGVNIRVRAVARMEGSIGRVGCQSNGLMLGCRHA